jgi:uncharacterized membrane protein
MKPIDQLPMVDGFRMRGMQITRIETFTDAAFAFAVTLLVVSIDAIPSTYDDLVLAFKGIPAFAVSFTLLFLFWYAHHDWSRRYGLDDIITIALSGLLVFLVMIYVYPLKMMSNGMVAFLSGISGDESASLAITSASELQGLFLIYGIGYVAMSATVFGCYAHALRMREQLQLNELELFDTRAKLREWMTMACVGLISCMLAVVIPHDHPITYYGVPGWAYMTLAVVMPLHGWRTDRERRKFLNSSAG